MILHTGTVVKKFQLIESRWKIELSPTSNSAFPQKPAALRAPYVCKVDEVCFGKRERGVPMSSYVLSVGLNGMKGQVHQIYPLPQSLTETLHRT